MELAINDVRRNRTGWGRLGRWLPGAGVLALLLLVSGPALAEDKPLERASKLRNEAAEDWNQKRHGAAAEKLRTALEIYDRTEGESPSDRAITLRALIWNLVKTADVAAALQSFEALMDIVLTDERVYPEADSAMSAIWEAASAASTLAAATEAMDPVRQAAAARSLDALQAQALHNLGSLSRNHKQIETAAGYFEEAIALRRSIGDATGEAWSLNNLANLHLMNGALKPALQRLHEAYLLMHTERVLPPQQSIAWNVKKAIEDLQAAPDKHGVQWLLGLGKAGSNSGFGAAVPPSHLDREALALSEKTGKKADVLKVAGVLAKQSTQRAVPEIAADLKIRAALAACKLGKGKKATTWLKKLELGQGPCRPHLEARQKTALALAYADKRGKKRFPAAAREAAKAWRNLGDFRGRVNALAALAAAAKGADLEDAIPGVVKESAEAARQGGPGGDGGGAASGGDRSKAGDLPLDHPLFHIFMDGNEIRIEDRAANHSMKHAVRWKPKRIGINGLALTLFGGYVVVESIHYGGASISTSAPGDTTLDALGIYMPIPAKGSLVVQKNGALRYETAPVSPR